MNTEIFVLCLSNSSLTALDEHLCLANFYELLLYTVMFLWVCSEVKKSLPRAFRFSSSVYEILVDAFHIF